MSDGGSERRRGVRGGYGVSHIIFELRMSGVQRDGCVVMRTLRLDPSFGATDFERGRVVCVAV